MKVKRKIGLDSCIGNAYFNFKESDSIHAPIWNFYPKHGEGFERVHERELEFLEDSEKKIDYEQRRYEIAKAILSGWATDGDGYMNAVNCNTCSLEIVRPYCKRAVEVADMLIAELKKKEDETKDLPSKTA